MLTKNLHQVSQLAQERGYILKTQMLDDAHIYWVEGNLLIGKPYRSLREIVLFLMKLPPSPAAELPSLH